MQTLEIARELQQAGISETSSYEMAEIINGKSGLATREDITKLEGELKNKATKEDIHEVREDITKLEGELKNKATKENIHEIRTEIHNVEKNLEGQIHTLRAEVKEDIGKLGNRMGKLETSNKWLVAIQLAILALLLKDVFLQ